jgi:hypothetical protein
MLHLNKIVYYCAFFACLISLQGCGGGEEKKEVDVDAEGETEAGTRRQMGTADSDSNDFDLDDSECADGPSKTVANGIKPKGQTEKEREAAAAKVAEEKQKKLDEQRIAQAKAVAKKDYTGKNASVEIQEDAKKMHLFDQKSKDKTVQAAYVQREKDMAKSWNKTFKEAPIKESAMTLAVFGAAVKALDSKRMGDVKKWLQGESKTTGTAVLKKRSLLGRFWDFTKKFTKYGLLAAAVFFIAHMILYNVFGFNLAGKVLGWIEWVIDCIPGVGGPDGLYRKYFKNVFTGVYANRIDPLVASGLRKIGIKDPAHFAIKDGCKHGKVAQNNDKGERVCINSQDACKVEGEVCMYPGVYDPANPEEDLTSVVCTCTAQETVCQGTTIPSVWTKDSPHKCVPTCPPQQVTATNFGTLSNDMGFNTIDEVKFSLQATPIAPEAPVAGITVIDGQPAELKCTMVKTNVGTLPEQSITPPQCVVKNGRAEWDFQAMTKSFASDCKANPRLTYQTCNSYVTGWHAMGMGCTKTTTHQGKALNAASYSALTAEQKTQFDPAFSAAGAGITDSELIKAKHFDAMKAIIAHVGEKPCTVENGVSDADVINIFRGQREYCNEVRQAFKA